MNPNSFEFFVSEVKSLLDKAAESKGYNKTGIEGDNPVYNFMHNLFGDAHPLGEIIYKVIRFHNKGDKNDLLKIAAWAYLVWKHGGKS